MLLARLPSKMDERPWHRHYDPGVPTSIDYERITLPQMLERAAEATPERTALVFARSRLTYRELLSEVRRFAAALEHLGVGRETAVAIHLPNLPQTVIAYYAVLTLGGRVVLTNPLYTPREIEHQWKDAGCEVAITGDWLWNRVLELRGRVPVREFVLASIPEYLPFPWRQIAPLKLRKADPPLIARVAPEKGVHRFRDLIQRQRLSRWPRTGSETDVDLESIALLQYTGGTTGVSKAAMLTHRNLSVNAQQTRAWLGSTLGEHEVVLNALPLFHVYGMTVGMNLATLLGGTNVLLPNPRDTRALVQAIARERVTLFPGVPNLYNSLNQYPGIERIDVSSVKYCLSGSAPIAPEVLKRFEELTGALVIEGFGMTETSPLTHANPLGGGRKIGTVGLPISDTDARVVDPGDSERELPVGVEGELVVRGPQVMTGYWKREDETRLVLHDGWMHTGDLSVMDEQGYFRIVGRKKDMINSGGLKVFPDEVDAVLMSHDAILEAATIGVPDEKRGEVVKSFVVRKPGRALDVEEVLRHCRESLAPYKIPREIEFLSELPKSSVLKILRRELREREIAKRRIR